VLAGSIRKGDELDVFLGTWCADSFIEVPHLMKIVDTLRTGHRIALPVVLIPVNRTKTDPLPLLREQGVSIVPTIIVRRGTKELGRIEERPSGALEYDLLTAWRSST
jgi:hypothetical protein